MVRERAMVIHPPDKRPLKCAGKRSATPHSKLARRPRTRNSDFRRVGHPPPLT
jgi:hypothetical protein